MDTTLATPVVNAETEAYWAGVERGELLVPWCADCERAFFYPRSFCPTCWSEHVTLRASSGKGLVYSYTVVRRTGIPPFDELVPYVLAVIELVDEEVRMLSHVRGIAPEDVFVGMPVELAFEGLAGGFPVPIFRPRSER